MAVCRDCDQEMLAGVGCTAFPGRRPVEGEKCHDCSAPVGAMHHPGCDMERCDHGGQAIFCDACNDAKEATGLDYWQRMAAVDHGGPVSGQGVMPPGSGSPVLTFTDDQRAALRRMGVDEGDVRPGSDPLGARRAAAFSEAALSAREAIEAEARRQVLADAAVHEEVLRARMGSAIAAGLEDQASRHQGFRCDTTSNRDMFAVAGILTVSELVESVVKALSDGP